MSDEFFVLHAGKNKQDDSTETKIGFVVSKKIHKRAVIRNKIKRRLREAVSQYIKENNPPYISLIFGAKEASINTDYTQTLKSVYKLMDRMAKKFF